MVNIQASDRYTEGGYRETERRGCGSTFKKIRVFSGFGVDRSDGAAIILCSGEAARSP